MGRPPKDVTEAELAVLQVLWERGPSSVRELADVLYPGGGPSELATVQKLLERLLAKRCAARERRSRPQRFRAAIDRVELIGRRLQAVAETLCEGSYTPLLTHLVEGGALGQEELRHLRDLVERLERARPRRREG
jgi:predicted transcriptional regulator